eukprot:scaffold149298_cov45-Prasinocladus_malaysianus.AAC.1
MGAGYQSYDIDGHESWTKRKIYNPCGRLRYTPLHAIVEQPLNGLRLITLIVIACLLVAHAWWRQDTSQHACM